MPKATVSFAESALRDLEEIEAWYTEQGALEVGEQLVMEILQRVVSLEDHPKIGGIVPEFGQTYLREIIRPPFRIVYKLDTDRVQIVRVWRSERLLRLPQGEQRLDR